jgi:exopolysaccharide biosynthesis polyprenyl glycosylphosphotransferase
VNLLKRRFFLNALKLLDLVIILVSFSVATFLPVHANSGSLPEFLAMRVKLSNCILFVIMIFLCYNMFSVCGLYESKRLSTKLAEIVDALKATSLSTACLGLIAILFSIRMITPLFLELFWLISSATVAVTRFVLRYLLASARRRGHNLHHILILGTNSRAIDFARRIKATPEHGYRLLGFVDDDWSRIDKFFATGFQLVCDFSGLAEFLRCNVVDEVAIYLPLRSFYEHAARMAMLCEQHGIIMRFDCDIFNLKIAKPRAHFLDGDSQITSHGVASDGWALVFKRIIDLSISSLLLVALAPLFLTIGALIKFSSAGPIFFRQKRVGLNKRQFVMYKFRTMVQNAEKAQEELLHLNEMTGPVFKIKLDPRITPIGRILRKASLDELPQLFNVFKGEMSLVGPRAMSVRDYQLFNEDWQRRRFSVRPGITCLWQVNGRNSISFDKWMELDMQYIDKWSIWLDVKILAQTIPAVLKGSGAA